MVLLYAVPLALFAGMVSTPRAELGEDTPLVIALCVAIIGLYSVVFLLARLAFRAQVSTSALAALTASAPSVPFVGPAVLGDLFGRPSAIPIAIGGLVINLTVVPVDGEFQNGRGIRGLADLDTITEMRDFLVLLLHLIVTIARLVKPSGFRSVVAESVLLRHQLLILNRGRRRAPNLRSADRIMASLCMLFIRRARLVRCAIVLQPSTLLHLHHVLTTRKYRLLFSPRRGHRPGPKGPTEELINAVLEIKR